MRKHLKELDGYIINNPFYDSEPLKHTFMRNAYLVYRKIRTCLAYFFPLSETQKIFWKNDKERIEKSEISKVVLQDFFQEKLIENDLKVTQLDHVIGMISFIYDINFKESYEFLIKKDYINKLIKRFDFKIEKQNMKEIQLYANEYVKKKIKDDRIE